MKKDDFYKVVINECINYINRSWDARRSFIQFFVTINLAYITGLYFLFTKCEFEFVNILSIIIFLINFSLFSMYMREHNAAMDNASQINTLLNLYPYIESKFIFLIDKYMSNEKFKDRYKNLTFFITTLMFSFFLIIPISLLGILLDVEACSKIIYFSLLFCSLLYYLAMVSVNNKDLYPFNFNNGNRYKKIRVNIKNLFKIIRKILFFIIFLMSILYLLKSFHKIIN